MPSIKSVENGVWACRWRSGGKQFFRHIKARTKSGAMEEIAKIIQAEAKNCGPGICWVPGFDRYSAAKIRGGANQRSMQDMELSINRLVSCITDKRVDETTRREFADFLHKASEDSSPNNANKHRRNLLAVARWLRKQGIVEQLPFEFVPSLPAPKNIRAPLPRENRDDFITCLPEWLQPPIMFALATSTRNSAICDFRISDIMPKEIILREKRKKVRRMLRDPVIDAILILAQKQREALNAQTDHVFSNSKGRGFSRNSLLKSAQHYWEKAGPGKWMIHSLRHTFGTEAGRAGLGVDAIRAGMGHDDRSSSAGYVHTDEAMASEVRAKIYENLSHLLSHFIPKARKTKDSCTKIRKMIKCPECGHKHMVEIDLSHKSL